MTGTKWPCRGSVRVPYGIIYLIRKKYEIKHSAFQKHA